MKNKVSCDAVLKAIKEVFDNKNRAFVDASNLSSNNQDSGNGDDVHFCKKSAYTLGQKCFDVFEKIKGKKC